MPTDLSFFDTRFVLFCDLMEFRRFAHRKHSQRDAGMNLAFFKFDGIIGWIIFIANTLISVFFTSLQREQMTRMLPCQPSGTKAYTSLPYRILPPSPTSMVLWCLWATFRVVITNSHNDSRKNSHKNSHMYSQKCAKMVIFWLEFSVEDHLRFFLIFLVSFVCVLSFWRTRLRDKRQRGSALTIKRP